MKAIVEFRESVYGPVLAEYNVAGRGHNHIQEKCALWGQMQGYGYWGVVYNLSSPIYDKLMTVNGWPTIRGAK
tara:strand:- start:330 stop:548 length:219 start_codon:yes stop_codon:yes gene_type:complete